MGVPGFHLYGGVPTKSFETVSKHASPKDGRLQKEMRKNTGCPKKSSDV